jgi:hypothetical protein
MHHGGPYPATTDAHFTSVGSAAIARFARQFASRIFPTRRCPWSCNKKPAQHLAAGGWATLRAEGEIRGQKSESGPSRTGHPKINPKSPIGRKTNP